MTKIDEFMKHIRANLTTEEMKTLMTELREEVNTSEKINLKEIKSDPLSEQDDLSDLFPDISL